MPPLPPYLRIFRSLPCTTNLHAAPSKDLWHLNHSFNWVLGASLQHFAPDQETISQAKAKVVFLAPTSKLPPPIALLPLQSSWYTWRHASAPLTYTSLDLRIHSFRCRLSTTASTQPPRVFISDYPVFLQSQLHRHRIDNAQPPQPLLLQNNPISGHYSKVILGT